MKHTQHYQIEKPKSAVETVTGYVVAIALGVGLAGLAVAWLS